jgi:hypothetical protein
VLPFTANGSGQIRIDLVECQPVATTLETSSRDIFNPATGLFVPGSVPKVATFGLQYRIRLGTPGAGVPALASGWLPLAAIVVPPGVANFTTCDFYDVRPLVEDRVEAQPGYAGGVYVANQYCPVRAAYFGSSGGGAYNINGYSESQFGGYRAGGWLRRSSPSFSGSFTGIGALDGDPDFFNALLPDNQVSAFVAAPNSITYLVAFFPAGLPRWVRYSHSAVGGGFGRIPKGPRGILKLTSRAPFKSGIADPQVLGSGFTGTAPGVVLGTIVYDNAGSTLLPGNANGGLYYFATGFTLVNQATASSTQVDFSLTDDIEYPPNASELLADISFSITNSNTVPVQFEILTHLDYGGTNMQWVDNRTVMVPAGVLSYAVQFTIRVPLLARYSPVEINSPPTTVRSVCSSTGSATFNTAANAQKFYPIGWRLGDG